MDYFAEMQNWLENYFINLMSTMERHIMLQVYREFNELFKTWFNILIEDEKISVRLDDEFTPVIEQNGYETYIDNLSGGEKTAVALSYRLALNKVISDIVADIKTKDILMLDEPTAGVNPYIRKRLKILLRKLRKQGKTILLIEHDMDFVMSLSDEVIVLDAGKKLMADKPEKVRKDKRVLEAYLGK